MSVITAFCSCIKPDNLSLALLGTVGLATVLAIGLLFFLHGAKLPREAIVAGIVHWRLHLTILCLTFVLFPVLGLMCCVLLAVVLGSAAYASRRLDFSHADEITVSFDPADGVRRPGEARAIDERGS